MDAVAGSGKTTTLIGRLVRLLLSGVSPDRMLVLMFNNSAAVSFKKRLSLACEKHGLIAPEVMTFHAYGKQLAQELERAGYLKTLTLVTETFRVRKLAQSALNLINERMPDGDQMDISADLIGEFLSVIEFIKSCSSEDDIHDYLKAKNAESVLADVKREFLEAFLEFEALRHQEGVRTLSDLIYDPVTAIRLEPSIATFVGNRYDQILVDEFQDVNRAQMEMLKAIAGTTAKVTAVGDDDQAIYVWRGANAEYMRTLFEQEFVGATRLSLPHTFRYGHRLALSANHVISNNKVRVDKLCLAHRTNPDTEIDVRMYNYNPGDPAVHAIHKWVEGGRSLSEVAVLVREYSHSISVEASLLRYGIPYLIVGAEPFFKRPEVLMLRGCMQLACGGLKSMNPAQRRGVVEAMLRIPGLYLKTDQLDAIEGLVMVDPGNFLQVMRLYEKRMAAAMGSSLFKLKNLNDAISNWTYFSGMPADTPAEDFLQTLVTKTRLFEYFTRNDSRPVETNEKVRMVQQIILAASAGGYSVAEFIAYLDDLSAKYQSINRNDPYVLITSGHRAKGMEWPCVIVPELAERQFPSYDKDDAKTIEDERRLFYVVITRAMERLTLICPKDMRLQQWVAGFNTASPDVKTITASRFLFEGNFYGSTLIGKHLHGKDVDALPPESPVIARYRTMVNQESEVI